MTCFNAGRSSDHGCHHSLFNIAPSSEVGFCMYCADQFLIEIEALTFSNSSRFQYSGQTGSGFSSSPKRAGKEIFSHLSALGSFSDRINLPVKSSSAHLVITTTIEPPGCKRCLGPDTYQSYALSIADSDIESCSVCGSSIISKSAPRPVIDPPTPAAKYSPPWLVSHLPFALLSSRSLTSPKILLYSWLSIKFLTLEPNLPANSALCETCIIFFLGYFPIKQAGYKKDANSDFV